MTETILSHVMFNFILCFILLSNKGPKGLLQVATKYNIIQCRVHTFILAYTHHTYTVFQKGRHQTHGRNSVIS